MKAIEYFNIHKEEVIKATESNSEYCSDPASISLLVSLHGEYSLICNQRKIDIHSEKAAAAAKELNKLWNAICALFERQYKREVLKRNLLWDYHVEYYPEHKLRV